MYNLVKNKEYFVLTTNVDHQFYKARFESNRIFATQGDYGEIQCENGCHKKVYQAKDLFMEMNQQRKDCSIPYSLVTKCPMCGKDMVMHLRCDDSFVEVEAFDDALNQYVRFLSKNIDKKVVF